MSLHRPKWFSDDFVMVSTAPTCGLSKGGRLLNKVEPLTAKRVQVLDSETGEYVDAVNDQLLADVEALAALDAPPPADEHLLPDTLTFVESSTVKLNTAVPIYYDRRFPADFALAMTRPEFVDFDSATLGELISDERLTVRNGHGSPSQEQRIGEIPYIKVSDLRAGLVNINPTNRVPREVAEKIWRGQSSGLRAFDLLTPERTSKNIGDFCVLMPGQERVLLTKEIIILRPGPSANFDPFYLIWAMTLKVVRDQWRRIIFMQTNREDVGKRFHEIEIPVPRQNAQANLVSANFRDYYRTIAGARSKLEGYLSGSNSHHFFVSGVEASDAGD